VLPDTIDRAQFGSPSWLPGSHSFLYIRTQKLDKDARADGNATEVASLSATTLGGDPDSEPARVLGYEVNPA